MFISVQELIIRLRAYDEIRDGEAAQLMRAAADMLERAGVALPGEDGPALDLANTEVEL